jgi:hypothetical protein
MAPWVMPLYIFSGIIMAIGAYLTIRYRPYCTLKSPEREIAMELHRKKLMNESMNSEEIESNNLYKYQTKRYSFGDFLLMTSIPLHVFAGMDWFHLSPLYFLSVFFMLVIFVMPGSLMPYCFIYFTASFWKIKKDHALARINAYLAIFKGKILTDDEQYQYKNARANEVFFAFYRYTINFGVVLHLLLDVWFGLNGSLMVN